MKPPKTQTIIHKPSGQILAAQIRHADHYFSRLRGLIGSKPLKPQEGMLISPCKQIHTHFMRNPIDVVFIDKQHIVINTITALKPWRVSAYFPNAYYVLELPANTTGIIQPADKLIFQ